MSFPDCCPDSNQNRLFIHIALKIFRTNPPDAPVSYVHCNGESLFWEIIFIYQLMQHGPLRCRVDCYGAVFVF